ncbi:YopX family protein [Lactiplantibacillus plantarum]|uniref:YopX family protein n=1 Tax=Lactiplantibacillus plantarum TaxID=1590 RepID=UPI00155B0132|nr:YopX family protein [Lactiplantibacillus plantarum]
MIKFRAWNNECKIIRDCDELKGLTLDALDASDFKLEQFTGLTDVNGKDIYEGDIVHGYDQEPDRDDGYIGSSVTDVVNFKYGAFWIGDSWYKVMVMTQPIVEIIGNVHENPELLEADK